MIIVSEFYNLLNSSILALSEAKLEEEDKHKDRDSSQSEG